LHDVLNTTPIPIKTIAIVIPFEILIFILL
jgi:hypothetical protein